MNNVKNARRGNTNGGEKSRESSIVEVILINGNSEDEPQLEITAKDTVGHQGHRGDKFTKDHVFLQIHKDSFTIDSAYP